MIYILQGTEQYYVDETIQEMIHKHQIEQPIVISAEETPFSTVCQEIMSDDIFGTVKLIILKDIVNINEKEYFKQLTTQQASVLQHTPNILVLLIEREEKLTKSLEQSLQPILTLGKIIAVTKRQEVQTVKLMERELKTFSHKLTTKDIQLIIEKYQNNVALIMNDLAKIKLEKGQHTPITIHDFAVNNNLLEEQVFTLIQSLEKQDVQAVFSLLDNMLLYQQNVFGLLALLLKNYKETYQVYALQHVGYNLTQIANRLSIHPYRTKILAKSASKLSEVTLQQIIQLIIDSESRLKQGTSQNIVIKELLLHILAV